MRETARHLVVGVATLLAATLTFAQDQSARQTPLEVTNVQFELLQQGKNVVRVEVRNLSDSDQVFRTHIGTRSPEYGRSGAGWGTGFVKTIPAGKTVWTRFVFKIQGPMTKSTYVKLTFSSPGPQEGFDEEAWLKGGGSKQSFKQTVYQAGDLPWASTDSQQDQPASDEQAKTVADVFRRIQNSIGARDYAQAWQLFTTDYQEAEFQSTRSDQFVKAMESQKPIDSIFHWEKASFLGLQPSRVVLRAGKLSLLAETQGQTWTLDFVQEDGRWKLDWIAGYTPRFLAWQNWEEHALPRMNKHVTEHFDIYFFRDSTAARQIEQIAQDKERGYKEICGFLGADPNVRIRLVLFEDKAAKHWETGHQGMGWAYDKTIVEVYNEKESLDPFHETVHILMGSVGSPPALFNEGFAVYMSQRLGARALEDLSGGHATIDERARELKGRGEWTELAELMSYTEIGSAESRPPIAYPEAASFVKFLVDTYGKDKFLQVCRTLKNSDNQDVCAQNTAELAAIYGESWPQLQAAWEAALMSNAERK
jgi:hypothetical protein